MDTLRPMTFAYRNFEVRAYDPKATLPLKISDPLDPDRVVRFRGSDQTVDRYDEVIIQAGWDFTEFAKNPVMMQFHDYSQWPIGRVVAVGVIDDALMLDAEFDPPEVDESADLVFRKVKHGTVRSGSVAFIPDPNAVVERSAKEIPAADKELLERFPAARRIYKKQSLLEWTICPIPANPNAIAAQLRSAYAKRYGDILGALPDQTAADNAAMQMVVERIDRLLSEIKTGYELVNKRR